MGERMDRSFGASKTKNSFFAILFVLVWGGFILWNFFLPSKEFSESENRTLASFPEYTTKRLLDGGFMDDMNIFLNDQFVGRPYWVAGHSLVEYGLGKREINDIYIGKNSLYRHYSMGRETITQNNIRGINAFFEQYQIPTSVMLIPSSTCILEGNLPFLATAWDETSYITDIYARLDKSIITVDISSALIEESNDVFYRTDHHWTGRGAYLGFLQLSSTMGWPNREAELMISPLSDSFLGTYHSRTGFPFVDADLMELYQIGTYTRYETRKSIGTNTETTEYDSIFFPEFLDKKDKYSYFLGTLENIVTIYTDAKTDKKIIIFKDSYAHCFAPMLMAEYSEIRLVELRTLTAADYGETLEIDRYDEALFLYSSDVFSGQVGPSKLFA